MLGGMGHAGSCHAASLNPIQDVRRSVPLPACRATPGGAQPPHASQTLQMGPLMPENTNWWSGPANGGLLYPGGMGAVYGGRAGMQNVEMGSGSSVHRAWWPPSSSSTPDRMREREGSCWPPGHDPLAPVPSPLVCHPYAPSMPDRGLAHELLQGAEQCTHLKRS